jgi:uncharacterized protein (TIGR03790 family)
MQQIPSFKPGKIYSWAAHAFVCCALLWLLPQALALQADNLLLITNSNVPQGKKLADFYVQQRHVPDHRILQLDLPVTEEMTAQDYDRKVVPVVRDYLRTNHLESQVTCLVTFYGVPIRIAARVNSAEDEAEQKALQSELAQLPQKIEPHVTALESLAAQVNPAFKPVLSSMSLESLSHRADTATHTIAAAISSWPKDQREKTETKVLVQIEKLIGPIGMLQKQLKNATSHPGTQPSTRAAGIYAQFHRDMREATEHSYDPLAREHARNLAREGLGLFEYGALLRSQLVLFETERTTASFDSELALLWREYPRSGWIDNPLNYRMGRSRSSGVLMVMRLDGPQTGTVSQMILASLHAEREGLKGRIVIDSRGLPAKDANGHVDAYGQYDQGLRNLADLVQSKTKLSMVFDDRPEVLSADQPISNVAMYMGWYSVDKYVPACQFNPGAVGFHLASYTMITLRREDPRCWVRGMLDDGIAATLGPVAEPYLQAFPQADDFFPLLMTGKLTLAEVYWKTTPWTSWMISMVGDPLYTPYKVNPPLAVKDLLPRLQGIFGTPATNPTANLPR